MGEINWQLVLCGINHKTSSLEQREPLQLGRDEIAGAHSAFSEIPGIMEVAIISTCNRIEIYFVAEKDIDPFAATAAFFKKIKNVDISGLSDNFYIRKGKHVAGHLLRVAAGIDSMVLGENQILSQIKDAYSSACAVGTAGKVVHRLFHQAFRVGKQVRSDTAMGCGACSVSSVAVEMLKTKIDRLEKPSILFVGINRMTALAAKNLENLDYDKFIFANRTVEKAEAFAEKYRGEGYPLKELPQLLPRADVIISCTGARGAVITRPMIDAYLKEHANRKLFILDMAVPRDIDIEKNYSPALELYDLEDIGEFVKEGQKKREEAIPEAEQIIERLLGEFIYWFGHVKHEPMYNGLEKAFEEIRREEIADLVDRMPPDLKGDCEEISRRLIKRLLQVKIRASKHSKTE
ncbi:MAG: glutamyl-tRNA reductase [candidate division Zixibacteria bacterium]|nr:glutamyl-tRNA reductase [candidate division Zixibacteria bacterium]